MTAAAIVPLTALVGALVLSACGGALPGQVGDPFAQTCGVVDGDLHVVATATGNAIAGHLCDNIIQNDNATQETPYAGTPVCSYNVQGVAVSVYSDVPSDAQNFCTNNTPP